MTDDVPLICDPVPGPPMLLMVPKSWSPAQIEKLRQRWAAVTAGSHVDILATNNPRQPLTAARTEWPDAEFCAA